MLVKEIVGYEGKIGMTPKETRWYTRKLTDVSKLHKLGMETQLICVKITKV